jgi:hypothetical protein
MLVFVSKYPEDDRERGGVLQRVAAIDCLFSDFDRLYLQISFLRNIRLRVWTCGRLKIALANFFLHRRFIARSLREAEKVYVHACLNAAKLFPWNRELRKKVITDLHGLMPEEFLLAGNIVLARIFEHIERVTIRNSALLITVTDRMAQHFLRKYPSDVDAARILTLPIFRPGAGGEKPILLPDARKCHEGLQLVYAGGVECWQNIEPMLQILRRLTTAREDVRMSIYVPPDAVPGICRQVNSLGLRPFAVVGSLSHRTLLNEYAKMDAGFVLRDDIPVNQAAMPTKLIEYMTYGVAPIVLSPNIGDFPQHGYGYLLLDELFDPEKVAPAALEKIRRANFKALASIGAVTQQAKTALRAVITGGNSNPHGLKQA